MPDPAADTFHVYSRRGCHLCDVMIEELAALIGRRARIAVHDIDTDPALRQRFDTRVPVLMFDDHEICHYRLDRDAVRRALDTLA